VAAFLPHAFYLASRPLMLTESFDGIVTVHTRSEHESGHPLPTLQVDTLLEGVLPGINKAMLPFLLPACPVVLPTHP